MSVFFIFLDVGPATNGLRFPMAAAIVIRSHSKPPFRKTHLSIYEESIRVHFLEIDVRTEVLIAKADANLRSD